MTRAYRVKTKAASAQAGEASERHPLDVLLEGAVRSAAPVSKEVPDLGGARPAVAPRVGEIVGIVDGDALVCLAGSTASSAVRARATVDLHGAHVGRQALLVFEDADPARPIVIGVLRGAASSVESEGAGRVEVDADGERLVVTAKDQLVLRCGAASITLTKAGKVLIQGKYVSSRSSGVNRIKGGSVQIN